MGWSGVGWGGVEWSGTGDTSPVGAGVRLAQETGAGKEQNQKKRREKTAGDSRQGAEGEGEGEGGDAQRPPGDRAAREVRVSRRVPSARSARNGSYLVFLFYFILHTLAEKNKVEGTWRTQDREKRERAGRETAGQKSTAERQRVQEEQSTGAGMARTETQTDTRCSGEEGTRLRKRAPREASGRLPRY
jgi:hypothetical protein